MSKPWIFPLALFAVAVALRVVYVLALQEHPAFDAPMMDAAYHYDWARSLASGEEFQDGPFFRAPLYPLFLGALVKVFGAGAASGTLGIRLAQSVLGGLTAVLTYRLGSRAFGPPVGALAGVIVALSWVLVAFDAELLIPVVFVPLLLLALERLLWWNFEDAPKKALVVGVCFGLAAVARPNILALMPVLFAWTIWCSRSALSTAWGTAAALTVGTLLPIAPVTIHNVLEGDASLVATQAGVNLWIGNNPQSDGATAIVPGTPDGWWEGYYGAIAKAEEAEGRDLLPSEVSAHYGGKALVWMVSHPMDAARGWIHKARLLLGAEEIANNQDIEFTAFRTLPFLRWSPVRWDVLLGLSAVGFFIASRTRTGGASRSAKTLLLYLGVYSATIVLFFVNSRFRVPLIPVMAVGAAYTLVRAVEAARAQRWGPVLLALGSAGAIAAGSHWILPVGVLRSSASGLMDLGAAELRRGNTAAALQYLEEAHRLNPSHPQVCFQLASTMMFAGADPSQALVVLDRAMKVQGTPSTSGFGANIEPLRLELRLALGEVGAVLTDAESLLREAPANSKLRFVHGKALVLAGRLPEAIAAFQEQASDEPTNAEPLYVLGQIFESQGRDPEARDAFRKALARGRSMPPMIRAEIQRRLDALRTP